MKQIRDIWFPDGDQHFYRQLDANPLVGGKGTYQHKKFTEAMRHIPRKGRAVDIGAHVGLWTRVLAMQFDSVIAFEPMPGHVECWNMNLAGHENVELIQVALGAEEGEAHFTMPEDNTGHTHVSPSGAGIVSEVKRLDEYNIRDIDFVKIDVEGFEYDVLLGARETILRERPAIIVEQKPDNAERYGRKQRDALDLIKSWGARWIWEIGGDHFLKW